MCAIYVANLRVSQVDLSVLRKKLLSGLISLEHCFRLYWLSAVSWH